MSFNLDQLFVQQYSSTLELLVQQYMSKLRGTVMEGSHIGDSASPVDQEGPVEAVSPAGRGAAMPRVDSVMDRRWIFPTDKELPQLVYSFDELRVFNDPMSQKMRNAIAAFGRAWDREVLGAFRGTNKVGTKGETNRTFGQSLTALNKVAAGGTKLTSAKIKKARKLLETHDVDLDAEPAYIIINADQKEALLEDTTKELLSFDYTRAGNLESGKIGRFLGFDFIECQRVTEHRVSNVDYIPVYVKSGMYLGFWKDLNADIKRRADLSGNPWQAYSCSTFGATRIEEKKCVEIACTV